MKKHLKDVKETSSHYIVTHSDGHVLKVAKKPLSAEHKAEMDLHVKKFAEGGEASEETTPAAEEQPEAPEQPTEQPTAPDNSLAQAQSDLSALKGTPVPTENAPQESSRAPASQDFTKQQEDLYKQTADSEATANKDIYNSEVAKQKALNDLNSQFQQNMQHEDNKVQEALKDFADTKIDPNRFMNSQSTGQKIQNGIALFLGGLGSGLVGGANPAAEFIQNQIEKDLQAQRENLGTKKSLLSAAIEHRGDVEKGYQFARALAMDNAASDVAKILAKSKSQQAQLNGQALITALKAKSAQDKQSLAQQELIHGVTSKPIDSFNNEQDFNNHLNQLKAIDPKLETEARKRYLPGIGVSSVDISPKDREAAEKLTKFQKLINESEAFVHQMGKLGAWSPANQTKAKDLREEILTAGNDLTGLNRLNGHEAEAYRALAKNIGSNDLFGTATQNIKDLQSATKRNVSSLRQTLGVKEFSKHSDADAVAWARQHPDDPRAAKILAHNNQS